MYDPDLCFREIVRRQTAGEPLITKEEKETLRKKYYGSSSDSKKDSKESSKESKDSSESTKESKEPKESTKESKESKESAKESKESKESANDSEESKESKEDSNSKNDDITKKVVKEEAKDVKEESDVKEEVDDVKKEPKTEAKEVEEMETDKVEVKEESDVKKVVKDEPKTEVKEEVDDAAAKETKEEKMETDEIEDDKVKVEEKIKEEDKEGAEADTVEKEKVSDESKTPADKEEAMETDQSANEVKDKEKTVATPPPAASPSLTRRADDNTSALISLRQMDEAMARLGGSLGLEGLSSTEPTVAQLLAQSAANPVKWPKDQVLQGRIENIMYAVENGKWPPESQNSSSSMSGSSGQSSHQDLAVLEEQQRKRRALEAEAERAHLQALLHPNLHHTLGLKIPNLPPHSAAAALATSFANATLRSFLEGGEDRSGVSTGGDKALRQLQALQGSLDLTIKPVGTVSSPVSSLDSLVPRRGPGRPRLDDPTRNASEKRSADGGDSRGGQEKKRRKLDEIVLGLNSSRVGKSSSGEANNPLALLRGAGITLHAGSRGDKSQTTNSITGPKLSSSISITPSGGSSKRPPSRGDYPSAEELAKSASPDNVKDGNGGSSSKPGLVKQAELPPGISLPPGIELYRPTDSKVDKWLEQHQGLLGGDVGSPKSPKDNKRRHFDLQSIDWARFSGDEHVPVCNLSSGQRVSSINFFIYRHLNFKKCFDKKIE